MMHTLQVTQYILNDAHFTPDDIYVETKHTHLCHSLLSVKCLSHVEDCLMRKVMLAEALLEKGINADMNEILPKIVDGLRYVKCYVIEYSDLE